MSVVSDSSVIDYLKDIYRDSQIYQCKACGERVRYPWEESPCNMCKGEEFIHIGEDGKSVEGSFQWFIATAKGEKV